MVSRRRPITNVYVDGFNFYHGCIRDTAYKWLDFGSYFEKIFPNNDIRRIRYFTALVEPRDDDPDQLVRQQTYIRALETIPSLTVHYGLFQTNIKIRYLADTRPGAPPQKVRVLNSEEKGSDVKLASHLLMDGFDKDYEVAIVVSNDSDLAEPIRLVRERLGLTVGLLNPRQKTAFGLQGVADFYRAVRKGALRDSQFPRRLVDGNGTITKPEGW